MRAERITAARLRLLEFATTHTLDELLEKTIDEAEELSGSLIGFYHFVDDDQENLTLENWSTRTKTEFCKAEGKWSHYPIADAGVWVDCVRARRPVVHNDYAALAHRKGLPAGHANVIRELVVPVLRGDKILAILGVGNKAADYDQADVEAVPLLADLAWDVAERKLAEKALRESDRLLKETQAITGFGGWQYDAATKRITWTDEVYHIYGVGRDYDPSDLDRAIGYYAPECAPLIEQAFRQAVEQGEPYDLEVEFIRRGGQRIWVRTSGRPVVENGKVVRITGNIGDVTERKAVELAREQYRRFFRLSTDAMCIADPFGCFKEVNPAFLAVTGYSEEELTAKPFLNFVLEEDRERTANEMALQVSQRTSLNFENRYVCKDGRTILLSWNAYFDSTDGVTYAIARDITETRRAQDAVGRLAAIVESSNDAVFMISPDLSILSWNVAAERLYGWSAEEAVGRILRDRIDVPPDLSERQREILQRAFAGTATEGYDTIRFGRDRRRVDVSLTVFPIRDRADVVVAVGSVHRDISGRKRAEAALLESEGRFRLLFDNMVEGFGLHEVITGDQGDVVDFRFLDINPAYERLTGLKHDDVIGKTMLEQPSADPAQISIYGNVAMTGEPYSFQYYSNIFGKHLRVHVFSPRRGLFAAVFDDITERMEIEQELRESRALLQSIVDGTTDAVFVKDLQGRYVMANKTVLQTVGKTAGEILGNDDYALFPGAEAKAVMDRDRMAIESGQTATYEEEVSTADGQPRTYLATKGPVRDANGKVIGLFGISRDITERKRMEAVLLQSQKLESLGELAGGLAHDFNNILTVILGNCALATRGMEPGSPGLQEIQEVEKAAVRGADLARFLLDAAGGAESARRPVDLNVLLEDAVGLLMPSFMARIGIQYDLSPDLPLISADAVQVQRALSTLVVNAVEALGAGGGHLVLATGVGGAGGANVESGLSSHDLKEGMYVYVDVMDDGPGIAPEVLPRVFDPFFTTKFSGRGLGLSAAQGIVRAHGGAIAVTSEVGKGAKFRVPLPVPVEDSPRRE